MITSIIHEEDNMILDVALLLFIGYIPTYCMHSASKHVSIAFCSQYVSSRLTFCVHGHVGVCSSATLDVQITCLAASKGQVPDPCTAEVQGRPFNKFPATATFV